MALSCVIRCPILHVYMRTPQHPYDARYAVKCSPRPHACSDSYHDLFRSPTITSLLPSRHEHAAPLPGDHTLSTALPHSVYVKCLRQRQRLCGCRLAHDAVGLDDITLWVDAHLGHTVVEVHILLADVAASLDGLDAFPETIGRDGARADGGFRDEEHRRRGDEGREHGPRDDGLDRRNRRVGIALWKGFLWLVPWPSTARLAG